MLFALQRAGSGLIARNTLVRPSAVAQLAVAQFGYFPIATSRATRTEFREAGASTENEQIWLCESAVMHSRECTLHFPPPGLTNAHPLCQLQKFQSNRYIEPAKNDTGRTARSSLVHV